MQGVDSFKKETNNPNFDDVLNSLKGVLNSKQFKDFKETTKNWTKEQKEKFVKYLKNDVNPKLRNLQEEIQKKGLKEKFKVFLSKTNKYLEQKGWKQKARQIAEEAKKGWLDFKNDTKEEGFTNAVKKKATSLGNLLKSKLNKIKNSKSYQEQIGPRIESLKEAIIEKAKEFNKRKKQIENSDDYLDFKYHNNDK